MTIEYILSENDFLQYYLYRASQSKVVKKRKNRGWILIVWAFTMFALLFYFDHDMPLAYVFGSFAVLYGFLYPNLIKKSYRNIIKRQTLPQLKHNFDKTVKMVITETDITTSNFAGESKIYLSAINEVAETADHFFISTLTGSSFIIPKFGLAQLGDLETLLERIAVNMGVEYRKDLHLKLGIDG